jgi:putative DNA methylase
MTATSYPVISPKKLIEVALPLDAINAASEHEKSVPRRGHPATFHLWWARRPLAAARGVLFAQSVNDPADVWRLQNPNKEANAQQRAAWTKARNALLSILEELVKWENTSNERLLKDAQAAISASWQQTCDLNRGHPDAANLFDPHILPAAYDPFAGGGTIPLEAQRLGFRALAGDLNPVPVLINKALIEVPGRFRELAPVNRPSRARSGLLPPRWAGAAGLAADVRHYGEWVRNEAANMLAGPYREVDVTHALAGGRPDLTTLIGSRLTPIAWLWARTIKSPSPAFAGVPVPLVSTFVLSTKKGKEAWIEPILGDGNYRFEVRRGVPPEKAKEGTKVARGGHFRCLLSNAPIHVDAIREAGCRGELGQTLLAVVAEGPSGRVYLSPTSIDERIATEVTPQWQPSEPINHNPRDIRSQLYGLTTYGDLFTARQLAALTNLSDLIRQVAERVRQDAVDAGWRDDSRGIEDGGDGAKAYGEAVSLYLAFALSKQTDWCNSLCSYIPAIEGLGHLFSKQAIPMVWDFAEVNPFSSSAGNFLNHVEWVSRMIDAAPAERHSKAIQADAASDSIEGPCVVSTDPPYYDNIGYADLSDFFYVWLRRTLRDCFPRLLSTILVPKAEELVASPHRHGGKEAAEDFFLDGMGKVFSRLAAITHPAVPMTIYYAFKQSETRVGGTSSAGWETFLQAVVNAGLCVTGTWPMRTERAARSVGQGANVLASSIVLVCRPRVGLAGSISRRQFVRMLNEALPAALDAMTRADEGEHSPVAPVDLSQAIIGPGMAIFSRYDAVLEADGSPMSVKTALQLINRFLAEDDFDADTQFCLSWFEQHGWDAAKFGEADTLARAKGTSVDGVKQAGVAEAGGGNVRLLRWKEYAADWDPSSDVRLPVWEALHQLIRAYNTKGDAGAAKVLAQTASKAEAMRQLAYRLYTVCERKGRADDARAYNEVVTGWTGIETAASKESAAVQGQLFEN